MRIKDFRAALCSGEILYSSDISRGKISRLFERDCQATSGIWLKSIIVLLRGYVDVHLFQLDSYLVRDLVPPIQTKTEASIDLVAID